MASNNANQTKKSPLQVWVSIAILAVLGILLAVNFSRVQKAVSEIFKDDGLDTEKGSGGTMSSLKQFDVKQLKVPAEYAAEASDYRTARALTDPKVAAADAPETRYIRDDHVVVGVAAGDAACAFPILVMHYHLAVNYQLGNQPIVVTYSPITMSSAVYSREVGGGVRTFEVTSQLYNNGLLFHDKGQPADTLWAQMNGQGLIGPDTGKQLTPLNHDVTTWGRWKAKHPNTQALTTDTGFQFFSYGVNHYTAYIIDAAGPNYPFANKDDSVEWRQAVLGIRVGDKVRAYPLDKLQKLTAPLEQTLAGKRFSIEYVPDNSEYQLAVLSTADPGVISQYALWYAWHAYFPETEVYLGQ